MIIEAAKHFDDLIIVITIYFENLGWAGFEVKTTIEVTERSKKQKNNWSDKNNWRDRNIWFDKTTETTEIGKTKLIEGQNNWNWC